MKEKVALVVQGGGTRGAFAAGVLDYLFDRNLQFPYTIGTSAGALVLANFLSGDRGRSKIILTKIMTSSEFVSIQNRLFRGTLFDFNFLFNELPNTLPFDFEHFYSNPSRLLMATTCMKDGKVTYFEKKPGYDENVFTYLTATSSLPLLARPVVIGEEKYMDGGQVAAVPFKKPFLDGYDKIVVIATRSKGFRKLPTKGLESSIAKSMYRDYPEFLQTFLDRWALYNQDMDALDELEKEGKAFIIRPNGPVDVGLAERDTKKLLALYNRGYDECIIQCPSLLAFLGIDHE